MKAHNQWASKLGFILATAGAAVGLGKSVEISLFNGKKRRIFLPDRLSDLYLYLRYSGYDHGDVPGKKDAP